MPAALLRLEQHHPFVGRHRQPLALEIAAFRMVYIVCIGRAYRDALDAESLEGRQHGAHRRDRRPLEFAGDLITLFIYWEAMAITSVFMIWARRTDAAYRAGMRYLVVQVGSGVLLLSGAILIAHETGSIAFEKMILGSLATWLILIAFGIKCGFPFFHNWLPDAYPEATVTGTVFLSAFTTKCAVYVLARGFPGTELLIYVGAAMAAFPLIYAAIENDLREALAQGQFELYYQPKIDLASGGLAGYGRDTWIAAQLKSKLLFDKQVSSINYSIDTVRGKVFLIGLAQSRQELDRVINHARSIDYVKKVVSYVKIKRPPA